MIETVYSKENGDGDQTKRLQSSFRMPKNIRQVGKSNPNKKIYVEDYVMTFIKQLVGDDYSRSKVAVLVGQYIRTESSQNIFISGAVEVEGIDNNGDIIFSNDAWTTIYENIKKYFVEYEIVGWALGGPGYLLEDKEKIKKLHIDNFAGQDKTLMIYDNMERLESFWFFQAGQLVKQDGYYIYYDKNEDMQSYMIDHNQIESEESKYDDSVSREIRKVIKENKPQKQESKGGVRLIHAVGTLFAVIILIGAAAILDYNDKMKSMQNTLESLTAEDKDLDMVFKEPIPTTKSEKEIVPEDNKNDNENDNENEAEEGNLDVEVVAGNVSPIEEEASDDSEDKMVEIKPTKKPKAQPASDQEGDTSYYEVAAGDTLAGISYKLYNSPDYIEEIMRLNNIDDENYIFVGQKLIVP